MSSMKPMVNPSLGDDTILAYDVERVRQDFPILSREVYGKPLV